MFTSLRRDTAVHIFAFSTSHIVNVYSRECAGNVNASAIRLVNKVSRISGPRIIGILHESLTSEAQGISTTSIQYVDPESEYPTPWPQPIIYGFWLPPRYFSRTPSTDIVVKLFCQMVSYVGVHQAWHEYECINWSTTSPARVRHFLRVFPFPANSDIQWFSDLERSWTGDEVQDQQLFSSLGPSTCANLIKVGTRYPAYSKPTLL